MGITFSPNGMFYKYFSFHNNLFKIGWPFTNVQLEIKKKKKKKMLIISCQQTERSLYSLLFYETKTIISALVGKIYFPHPVVLQA